MFAFLTSLLSLFTSARNTSRSRPRFLPSLERLEDRWCPATGNTYTWTNTAMNADWTDPHNWSSSDGGTQYPGFAITDLAIFNGATSNANVSTHTPTNMGGIDFNGYTGVVTLTGDTTLAGSNASGWSLTGPALKLEGYCDAAIGGAYNLSISNGVYGGSTTGTGFNAVTINSSDTSKTLTFAKNTSGTGSSINGNTAIYTQDELVVNSRVSINNDEFDLHFKKAVDPSLDNNATIDVTSGSMVIYNDASVTYSDAVTNESTGIIDVFGGETLKTGLAITNNGLFGVGYIDSSAGYLETTTAAVSANSNAAITNTGTGVFVEQAGTGNTTVVTVDKGNFLNTNGGTLKVYDNTQMTFSNAAIGIDQTKTSSVAPTFQFSNLDRTGLFTVSGGGVEIDDGSFSTTVKYNGSPTQGKVNANSFTIASTGGSTLKVTTIGGVPAGKTWNLMDQGSGLITGNFNSVSLPTGFSENTPTDVISVSN